MSIQHPDRGCRSRNFTTSPRPMQWVREGAKEVSSGSCSLVIQPHIPVLGPNLTSQLYHLVVCRKSAEESGLSGPIPPAQLEDRWPAIRCCKGYISDTTCLGLPGRTAAPRGRPPGTTPGRFSAVRTGSPRQVVSGRYLTEVPTCFASRSSRSYVGDTLESA